MNHSILTTIVGSMLAMAPMVDSTVQIQRELTRPQLSDTDLVVHEWGTFTSLQGSDGVPTLGMHHEEEHLPNFVHSRDAMSETRQGVRIPGRCSNFGKSFEHNCRPDTFGPAKPLRVTQKMETPVLYFYAKNGVPNVKVKVDFPQGIISQYYPAPSTFAPALNMIEKIGQGSVTFDFGIQPANQTLHIPLVAPDSVYAPSREVKSNYIETTSSETEKLIFYRGLGDFSTTVSVTSDETGNLQIHNGSKSLTTPSAILLYSNGSEDGKSSGSFLVLPELHPGEVRVITKNEVDRIMNTKDEDFVSKVSDVLVKQLVQTGLYEDEAVAMANTWKRSYFLNSGLRLLHILSSEETERLLPLQMMPAPTEKVRTLVGRIEIMTYQEERELLALVSQQRLLFSPQMLGRLAEPKLRRLLEVAEPNLKVKIERYIEQIQ